MHVVMLCTHDYQYTIVHSYAKCKDTLKASSNGQQQRRHECQVIQVVQLAWRCSGQLGLIEKSGSDSLTQ